MANLRWVTTKNTHLLTMIRSSDIIQYSFNIIIKSNWYHWTKLFFAIQSHPLSHWINYGWIEHGFAEFTTFRINHFCSFCHRIFNHFSHVGCTVHAW
ncbi:Uncharacterised protein [Klebsiella pneumoniae]|nr:Uncharacterised protein [Klebsiella pneumoniae]